MSRSSSPPAGSERRTDPSCCGPRHWSERQWRTYLYIYHRFVEQVDARVGSVLAALQESGLDESTLVVFTSDHGEGMARPSMGDQAHAVRGVDDGARCCCAGRGHLPGKRKRRDSSRLRARPACRPWPTTPACRFPRVSAARACDRRSSSRHLPGADFVVAELQPDPERTEMRGRMVRSGRYKYVAFSEGRNPRVAVRPARPTRSRPVTSPVSPPCRMS